MTRLADIQAERALLSAFLAKPALLDALALPPDAWTVSAHEAIAGALRWLYDAGLRVSEATVAQRLASLDVLRGIGGEATIYELAVGDALLVRAEVNHTRVVSLAALRRQREHLMRALASVEREDAAGAVTHCAAALETTMSAQADEIYRMQDLGIDSYHRATTPVEPSKGLIPTCIGAVDVDLIGSAPRDVVLVIAPTNVGKTSFSLTMLEGLLPKGIRAGLIQFEDSPRLTGDRIMSKHSRVPSRALRAQDMTRDQLESITKTAGVFSEFAPTMGYMVACLAGATEAEAIRVATQMVRLHGCRLVVFDYVQAIRCSTNEENRRLELLAIGSRIGAFAARNDVVAVITSQVTEDAEENKCPRLNQVRDCRDLANQSTTALSLWESPTDATLVMGRVMKSKVEGKRNTFAMRRGPGGMFIECDVPAESSGGYKVGRMR